MSRGLAVLALALGLVTGPVGDTQAARKAKSSVSKKKTKAKAKKRASRPARPKKRPNMPANWAWPPSLEMRAQGLACLDDLDALGVRWQTAPPEHAINAPILVEGMDFAGLIVERTRSKGPLVMDCALARALARDAAPVLRALGVERLQVGQIHAVRPLEGRPDVLSRHALGLAIDVYGFVDRSGHVHSVEHDYLRGDLVLHAAEVLLGRTGGFRTLMTPGNDPGPHYNHFHIEARAFGDKVVDRLVRGAYELGGVCSYVKLGPLCPRSTRRRG